jgi:hypothetical protein
MKRGVMKREVILATHGLKVVALDESLPIDQRLPN